MATLKLTDTQRVILAAAGARDSGLILPLPNNLRVNRGTQAIVLRGLLSKDMIAAQPALPGEEVWESKEDGAHTTLAITSTGLAAMGITSASSGSDEVAPTTKPRRKRTTATETAAIPKSRSKRSPTVERVTDAAAVEPGRDTKLGALLAALRRKKGATIANLTEATGWQAHSVRGAISGALKKKLGLEVTSEKAEGRERVYRIGGHQK